MVDEGGKGAWLYLPNRLAPAGAGGKPDTQYHWIAPPAPFPGKPRGRDVRRGWRDSRSRYIIHVRV